MKRKPLGAFVSLAPLLLAGLGLGAADAAAQESCVTAQCHAKVMKGRNVHPAFDPCDNCHEAAVTPHPQKGKKTFRLSQPPPGLCQTCHETYGTKGHVHPPVKSGMCTTCHNPHSANEPRLLTRPMKDLCLSCHPALGKLKVLHGPFSAGDCTSCHAPHESGTRALLLKDGDALCTGCHVDLLDTLKKPHLHPALQGGCTSCHNPHGADQPKLLAAAGAQACFQCHGDIEEKVARAASVHAPIKSEKACVSCHSPHAGDQPRLLMKPEKETCLGCHAGVLSKSMTMLHGPIRDGSCSRCHDPHASPYARLLVKGFPADPYAPYTDTEYALCFSCHKRDLLQYPDTSFATNFRDGERNLHHLHVNNRQKGRSCTLCHAMHGSFSPKLVAESVPFGKWNLPLKFVKTETGGGCSPGCHKPLNYDRQVAGRKPATPKPPGPTP